MLGSFPAAWAGKSGAKREGEDSLGSEREDDEVAGGPVGTALPERAARWAAALRKEQEPCGWTGHFPSRQIHQIPKGIWRSSAPLMESRKEGCAFSLRNRGRSFLWQRFAWGQKKKKKNKQPNNADGRKWASPKLGNDFLLEVQNHAKVIAERNTQNSRCPTTISVSFPFHSCSGLRRQPVDACLAVNSGAGRFRARGQFGFIPLYAAYLNIPTKGGHS